MAAVHALDGALGILVGIFPGNGLRPVQIGRHRITVSVFRNFVRIVTTIGRVGQTLADDGVTHPIYKLAVHGVGHFVLVHPEPVHRNFLLRCHGAPEGVLLVEAHTEEATLHLYHAIRSRLNKGRSALARHFAAVLHGGVGAQARAKYETQSQTEPQIRYFFHTHKNRTL